MVVKKHVDLEGRKALIIGAGISGIAAYNLLEKVGANPVLFDTKADLNLKEIKSKLDAGENAKVLAGTISDEEKDCIQLLVISPGVPCDSPMVEEFRERGVPVWGEIELAYACSKGKLIAITGTNGKTTTTALTGKIAEDYFGQCFIVGNIGNPYTAIATQTNEGSVVVAEISSFQLETTYEFHPQVSAILNITPDHLNRHHTMENYIAVKESIAANQTSEDVCVLNYEDEYTRDFGKRVGTKVVFFSSQTKLEEGIYLDGEEIFYAKNGEINRLLNIHEMKLLGTHNVENVMAAIAMTDCFGIPMDNILRTVKEFRAVEHRIEYVATKKGVDYYNDSKGTNPDAAIKGIQAMNRPTVLIGGGYDKGSTYDEWIEAFDGKVKKLVLLGATAEAIANCARKHGFTEIAMGESLEEVMKICVETAEPGDAVLLSPACASWGMFPNYEVRGKMFKELVNQLEG